MSPVIASSVRTHDLRSYTLSATPSRKDSSSTACAPTTTRSPSSRTKSPTSTLLLRSAAIRPSSRSPPLPLQLHGQRQHQQRRAIRSSGNDRESSRLCPSLLYRPPPPRLLLRSRQARLHHRQPPSPPRFRQFHPQSVMPTCRTRRRRLSCISSSPPSRPASPTARQRRQPHRFLRRRQCHSTRPISCLRCRRSPSTTACNCPALLPHRQHPRPSPLLPPLRLFPSSLPHLRLAQAPPRLLRCRQPRARPRLRAARRPRTASTLRRSTPTRSRCRRWASRTHAIRTAVPTARGRRARPGARGRDPTAR